LALVSSPFIRRQGRPFVAVVKKKDLVDLTQLIDGTYPLIQTPEAMTYVRKGHARGKVVITV
jgi:hypothetical protein